jgi:hypothetical protein
VETDRADRPDSAGEAAGRPGAALARLRQWPAGRLRLGVVVQLAIVVAVSVVSVQLRRGVPVVPNTSAYDGLLLARLARSLEAGSWLGGFDQLTLAKNPGYPAFMALSHWLGLELKTTEQLIALAAAASVALCILVTTRRPWLATAGYVVLAFDPSYFSAWSADVMRESVFASLGVLALGLAFLTVLGVVRRSRWVWIVLGGLGTGIAVSGYWLTREEGVTLLPPLAVLLAGMALATWAARRRAGGPRWSFARARAGRAGVALVLVLLAGAGPLFAVRAVNEAQYGVALLNDHAEGAILRAYADWSRVEAGEERHHIPITAAQRAAVYEVSPAARELRAYLEDPENHWRGYECATPGTAVCDYAGGWMPWAIRDAAVVAGEFDDPRTGQAFFARLSDEIQAACEDGRLRCRPRLPATLQSLDRAPLGALTDNLLLQLKHMLTGEFLYQPPTVNELPAEVRAEYAAVVHELPLTQAAADEELAGFLDRQWQYDRLGSVYRVLVPLAVVLGLIGVAIALVRIVRRRRRTPYLLALALALAVGVLVRAFVLALIQTADWNVVPRYLIPGHAMLLAFAVVGIALAWPPAASVGGAAAGLGHAQGEADDRQLDAADDQDHADDRQPHGGHRVERAEAAGTPVDQGQDEAEDARESQQAAH